MTGSLGWLEEWIAEWTEKKKKQNLLSIFMNISHFLAVHSGPTWWGIYNCMSFSMWQGSSFHYGSLKGQIFATYCLSLGNPVNLMPPDWDLKSGREIIALIPTLAVVSTVDVTVAIPASAPSVQRQHWPSVFQTWIFPWFLLILGLAFSLLSILSVPSPPSNKCFSYLSLLEFVSVVCMEK